jgi:HNH endonuclease
MTNETFWTNVLIREPEDCWPWTRQCNMNGYGRLYQGNKTVLAHRIAFELTYGPPTGIILHKCDNPACCNPRHLIDGTRAGNIHDMDVKQRRRTVAVKGSQHFNTLLTDDDVREIRRLYATGNVTQTALAAKFKTVQTTISSIVRRVTWKHVP